MTNESKLDFQIDFAASTNLFYVLAFFIATVIGAVASTGEKIPIILALGALVSLFLMFRPLILLWTVTLFTLVIAGSISYHFQSLNKIMWADYILAFMLYVPSFLHYSFLRNPDSKSPPGSVLIYPLLVFISICVLSSVMNSTSLWSIIQAFKSIFMYGGLWAALSLIDFSSTHIKKWLLALFGIGLIQVLPVLYQYLFVRSQRLQIGLGTVSASDSVVGTFGGSMEGGGMTAALAFYAVILVIGVFSFRRSHLISNFDLAWMLGLLMIPLLLVEVKAIFLYLPIAFAILYRDVLKSNPLVFMAGGIIVGSVVVLLIVGYSVFHWSSRGDVPLMEDLALSFSYSFEEESRGEQGMGGRMTRREVLEFWWDKHGMDEPLPMLIGHGLGASRTGGLFSSAGGPVSNSIGPASSSMGPLAKRYFPKEIDITGLGLWLWDVGLLGTLAILILLYSAYSQAGKLALSRNLEPWQNAVAATLQIVFVLIVVSLGYRNDIPYAATMMFILMASFGLVDWLHKQQMLPED